MCQTPPRVVTHQIWVEKPSSATSQSRSTSDRTPSRPSSHQPRPTSIAASAALIPDSQLVGGDGPDDRDERHEEDRRERGERHVAAAVDRDDVVRADRADGQAGRVEPGPAVEEGVGEVEEVAVLGVEEAVRQPVDRHRDDGDRETRRPSRDRGATVTPATTAVSRRAGRRGRADPRAARPRRARRASPRRRSGRRRAGVTPMRKTAVASGTRTAHHWRRSSRYATGSSSSIA